MLGKDLGAKGELVVGEEATVQLEADGTRSTSARVTGALTATGALAGIGLRAGVLTDATATVTIGPDGTPRRLVVSTAEVDKPGKPASLDPVTPVDTFVGDGHVYVTELDLDLTDPDVQHALADAGGSIDGVTSGLAATLTGAVYAPAVVAAAQLTVTEWAPVKTTGVDVTCGVGAVAEVSGGVTATHEREEAVVRHVKPAGRTLFTSERSAPGGPGAPVAPSGNGGSSW